MAPAGTTDLATQVDALTAVPGTPAPDAESLPKAFLVDDDPVMLGLLVRYLSRAGYQTIATADPTSAMTLALQHLPAIIIMDVMLPGRSGLAVLRELRHTPATRQIPVIVISANDHAETRLEARLGGASAFMVKPFGMKQFLDEINQARKAEPSLKD